MKNQKLQEINFNELTSINGGGIGADIGNAVGNGLAYMLHHKVYYTLPNGKKIVARGGLRGRAHRYNRRK